MPCVLGPCTRKSAAALPGPLLLFVPFIAGSFQAVVAVTALPALAMLLRQKARAAKPSP